MPVSRSWLVLKLVRRLVKQWRQRLLALCISTSKAVQKPLGHNLWRSFSRGFGSWSKEIASRLHERIEIWHCSLQIGLMCKASQSEEQARKATPQKEATNSHKSVHRRAAHRRRPKLLRCAPVWCKVAQPISISTRRMFWAKVDKGAWSSPGCPMLQRRFGTPSAPGTGAAKQPSKCSTTETLREKLSFSSAARVATPGLVLKTLGAKTVRLASDRPSCCLTAGVLSTSGGRCYQEYLVKQCPSDAAKATRL